MNKLGLLGLVFSGALTISGCTSESKETTEEWQEYKIVKNSEYSICVEEKPVYNISSKSLEKLLPIAKRRSKLTGKSEKAELLELCQRADIYKEENQNPKTVSDKEADLFINHYEEK